MNSAKLIVCVSFLAYSPLFSAAQTCPLLSVVPFTVVYFFAGLVCGIFVSSVVCFYKSKNRNITEEMRKKLESEEEERVRKIVIAQLYCDLKTQIQKHEWCRIEKEVRAELHEETKQRLTEQGIDSASDYIDSDLSEGTDSGEKQISDAATDRETR